MLVASTLEQKSLFFKQNSRGLMLLSTVIDPSVLYSLRWVALQPVRQTQQKDLTRFTLRWQNNYRFRNKSRSPDSSPTNRRPRVASRSTSRYNERYFRWRQPGHFAKEWPEKCTPSDNVCHMDAHISKAKCCSHPYKDDQDEEEVMVVMCHNDETYSFIQINKDDFN